MYGKNKSSVHEKRKRNLCYYETLSYVCSVYSVRYYPPFQVSAGGLGTYPLKIYISHLSKIDISRKKGDMFFRIKSLDGGTCNSIMKMFRCSSQGLH